MLKQRFLVLGALLAVAVVAAMLTTELLRDQAKQGTTTAEGQAAIGGPFNLVDHQGEATTQAAFEGQHMLIYFGYSYCPDICPMSLDTMTAAYDQLAPGVQEEVIPVFITVDPERDTVEAMRDYVALFHEDLVGLTGSQAQTDAAAKAYRVYYAKAPNEGEEDDEYLVDHSSFYYLMGPDGRYIRHFGHDNSAEDIAAGVREVLG